MSEEVLSHRARAVFRDPNETAARELRLRLLREILDYQARLTQLCAERTQQRGDLADSYRRAIRIRRTLLRDLPLAPEACAS